MVRIVDTRAEHIDDILRIEQQCFSLPWTREQLTAQMTDSMHVFLAAEAEKRQGSWLCRPYVRP